LAKDAQGSEDWAAVSRAVTARLGERGMSIAQLARESGLSETTIRYIANGRTDSMLVAISAVLGWRYDHLRNILHGEPDKNTQDLGEAAEPADSLAEPYFESQLRAELGSVRAEVAGLRDVVYRIDEKIDVIIQAQHADPGADAGRGEMA
jgi:lambda repressor-like predicted transcriptional regulator